MINIVGNASGRLKGGFDESRNFRAWLDSDE